MNSPFIKQLRKGKVKKMGKKGAKDPFEREWESGIFKNPFEDKLWLTKTGLKGDEIADTKVHGGPEKALFAYPVKHYEYWQKELQLEINAGGFGENLVVEGTDEFTTCLGDTYRFGDAIIEVSQPRQPCWKPARRFQVIDFALRIQQTGKTGWYFRVLQEGYVEGGVSMELLERPYPEWTIEKCNEVMHKKKDDLELTASLLACEALAQNWQRTFRRRLRGIQSDIAKRVYGPNKD